MVIIGSGINQIYKGWKERFRDDLCLQQMSAAEVRWATRAGKAGYIARGIVFGIAGVGLIFAAMNSDPSQARGLEATLDTIATQSYGRLLLGMIAVGLACYGLYCMIEARTATSGTRDLPIRLNASSIQTN